MTTTTERPAELDRSFWEDLVGVRFERDGRDPAKGLDCLGLAKVIYQRMGHEIPDPKGGWDDIVRGDDPIGAGVSSLGKAGWRSIPSEPDQLRPGDAVIMSWYRRDGAADHIGVYLGGDRLFHALYNLAADDDPQADPGRSSVTRLRAVLRLGKILGCWRPPEVPRAPLPGPQAAETLVSRPAEGWLAGQALPRSSQEVLLCLVPDPLTRPWRRDFARVPCPVGARVQDFLPVEWRRTGWQVIAGDGLQRLQMDDLAPGGRVLALARLPGLGFGLVGAILFFTALNLGVSFLVSLIAGPELEEPDEKEEFGSPTFRLSGIRNTALSGIAIPVVYGTHIVGGNVIQVFFTVDGEGKQILNMLIALCHGEIESIAGLKDSDEVAGGDIPQDIKINGTWAGEFRNVRISTRMGTELQTPIPGFANVVQAVPFEITLVVGSPFTHTTDDRIQAFQIVINFPAGLFNLSSSGSVGSRTVQFTFRWRVKGTTTWTTQTVNVTRATRAPFSFQFERENLTEDFYEIQVERISPPWPETESDKESRSDLVAINEITYDSLGYPGIALLGVRALSDEQLPGGEPPTVTSIVDGRKIWVPTSVASNGTVSFQGSQPQFNNNPAWCVMDLILHPVYGLFRNGTLTIDDVDVSAFLGWATLCDSMVADGRGGMVKRAECDLIIDFIRDGWDLVTALARSHWGELIAIGREISVVPQQARGVSAIFGMGQVADWSIKYQGRRSRANTVEAEYPNEEVDYERDLVQRVDDTIFSGTPVVKEVVALLGVTRPPQAYRMVAYRLKWADKIGALVQFTAGIESIHLLPGDRFRTHHDVAQPTDYSGRITAATTTTITLDKDITIAISSLSVRTVNTSTGAEKIVEVTLGPVSPTLFPAGTPLLHSGFAADEVPAATQPYMIGALLTYAKDWQIISIDTRPDLTRVISALTYDEDVFDDDPGVVETFTDPIPDPRQIPARVTSFTLTEVAVPALDGGVQHALDVSLVRASLTAAVDIFWRFRESPDGDPNPGEDVWSFAGRAQGDTHRITVGGADLNALIDVSVVPVSPRGTRGDPSQGVVRSIRLRGRREIPAAFQSSEVCVDQLGEMIELTVPAPGSSEREVDRVRLVVGGDNRRAACFEIGTWPIGQRALTFPPMAFGFGLVGKLMKVTRSGIESNKLDVPLVGARAHGRRLFVNGDEGGSSWPGSRTNVTVDAGQLRLDTAGGHLSGEYETLALPMSDGQTRTVLPILMLFSFLQEDGLTWFDAGFAWDSPRYADMKWDAPAGDEAGSFLRGYENEGVETWDDCAFPWEDPAIPGEPSALVGTITWDGPVDLIAGLEPTLDIDLDFGAGFTGWRKWVPYEPITKVEQIAARINFKSPHRRWTPRTSTLFTQAWDSFNNQVGQLRDELVKRMPLVPPDPKAWHGTNYSIIAGAPGWTLTLRDEMFDSAYITVPVPEWFANLDATNRVRWRVNWIGSLASAGGSSWLLALSHNASWDPSGLPLPAAPGLLPGHPLTIAIPAGYAAAQPVQSTIVIPQAGTPVIQQPNGLHVVELLIVRWIGDVYTGSIGIETIEIEHGELGC